MNNIDIDKAICYVSKIIDNVRCATCDRLQGSRLRYPCGHSTCEECVTYAEQCQICTPSFKESVSAPKSDYPLTVAVKNANNLLKASQSLFDINAFQHKRLSEQLRIEKELFPKCIQAPIKYRNKRKSTNCSAKGKENRYSHYFPGEIISLPKKNKMENYVQQWLIKHEKNLTRKPFSDLNVNRNNVISPINKNIKQNVGDENGSLSVSRKRSHFKLTDSDYSRLGGSRKSLNGYKNPPKKAKKESVDYLQNSCSNMQKNQNDESGIFMDNDPIIIDDSQESVIDKDKNAWLAVLKACEHEDLTSLNILSQDNTAISHYQTMNSDAFNKDSQTTRVPFFKRSAITEICRYCKNEMDSAKTVSVTNLSKPVKITIDDDNFFTTITVFKNVQKDSVMNTSCNVSVQTNANKSDYTDYNVSVNNSNIVELKDRKSVEREITKDVSENSSDKLSVDLFADDRKKYEEVHQRPETSKCIIEESDSDSDLDVSGPMSVKADVHRSCQDVEYGILGDIKNVEKHENKPRRGPRGHTPTSTDSSEKENYNPNRIRRHTTGKKKFTKKK